MILRDLLEVEGEFIPRKRATTPDRIAKDLLQGANGDPTLAKKMARRFMDHLLTSIDEQGQDMGMRSAGEGRPEQSYQTQQTAPGYEQSTARAQQYYGQA